LRVAAKGRIAVRFAVPVAEESVEKAVPVPIEKEDPALGTK